MSFETTVTYFGQLWSKISFLSNKKHLILRLKHCHDSSFTLSNLKLGRLVEDNNGILFSKFQIPRSLGSEARAFPLFFPSFLCVFSSGLCQCLPIKGRLVVFGPEASSLTLNIVCEYESSRSKNEDFLFFA